MLSAWTRIRSLILRDTQVSGSLDPSFAQWTALEDLQLTHTLVMGELSPAFSAWNLTSLDAEGTLLSGTLDSALAAWPITRLVLFRTLISGTIPASFSAWTALLRINIGSTRMSGTIPDAVAAWTSLLDGACGRRARRRPAPSLPRACLTHVHTPRSGASRRQLQRHAAQRRLRVEQRRPCQHFEQPLHGRHPQLQLACAGDPGRVELQPH